MNTTLYIETIKKECAFLEKEGYTFTQLENNIYYTKETSSEGFRIRFSWLEYGDKFTTQGLTAEKRFNIVEQEMQKVLGGELDAYYTIYKDPSINYIPKGLEFTEVEKNIRFTTSTVDDIELFTELVEIFYSKTALVFFKNYQNIDVVNNQLKELLEAKKIQSVLTSFQNTTILRFYVIAVTCVNTPMQAFFRETYFPYVKANLDNELNKIELENFKHLQRNLQANV